MPERNLFLIFLAPLNRLKIPYMVTGAAASIVYGQPRMTHDIDLVVEMNLGDATRLAAAFPLDSFYCPPLETMIAEIQSKRPGRFNLIHHATGFKADLYLAGEDALHRWAMQRRRKITLEEESIWIAPVEYVILRKLEYYREGASEKHLRDIAGMLAISGDIIDFRELWRKIDERGLQNEARKAALPNSTHP
ncbi:MAG: hypothetical protein KJ800_00975 [Proteobacteria bacterium]|nr:hypothetical protein [Pseudomonadota bacterium]MBU2028025.1 hypothetical protein [Pseudomonadota bacterium]MBU3931578.1 hypothetical protein [Pseudomonadota bacterium]MBU4121069.1 hypothetical protein [Pseudomonadota bacterium]